MVPPSVWVALVVVAVAAIVWKVATGGRGDARFVLTVNGPGIEGIEVRGQVPGIGADELTEFVAKLELPKGAKIWAVPDGDRLALRFTNVPEGPQQRVRNLVLSKLR
jgi:hypothetical protein